MNDNRRRRSFFQPRGQNGKVNEENPLFLKHDEMGIDVDASDTSLQSSNSNNNRRRSFNIFRGEQNGASRRATDPFLHSQIAEVQHEFDFDEDDDEGDDMLDSFRTRKKSIQSQIKELKLLKHKEATSIKSKIEKIKNVNSKKSFYITQLNVSLSKLQRDAPTDNLEMGDIQFGESFETDVLHDVSPVMTDSTMGSGSKHALQNSFQAITSFVKYRKEEEIEELNDIAEQLINARKKKVSLYKTLNQSLSSREAAITDLEGIVQSQAGIIANLRKEIDNSSLDDSTNNHHSSVEERYLSVSMQLNESQRSETQIAEDIKVMRQSMSNSIDKIKNLDKESESSTFECGKLGARNVFLRTNSVKIVDEVKTVYTSKTDVESTVIQLRTYLGLIGKLESYFLKQISKFSFEEEGMDAIIENVNYFLSSASQFNSLVQDATVILELLEAVEGVHPELLEEENVHQLARDIIKLCLSVEDPVVASLLSMKAMLTLTLGSLSKDDEFFTSLETMRKDIKESIEQDFVKDKRRRSSIKPKNSLSIPDTTRIVLECKLNQKRVEVACLEERCQDLNATAERLKDFCDDNAITYSC